MIILLLGNSFYFKACFSDELDLRFWMTNANTLVAVRERSSQHKPWLTLLSIQFQ